MRVLQIFTLLLFATVMADAQACGYSFLTIYLTDSKGQVVKNAEIKTFSSDFKTEDDLHYPGKEGSYDRMVKDIGWSPEKQAYFGAEGMCGGHKGVGLRIASKGFEIYEKVIDLPLGRTSFSIKLARVGRNELSEMSKLVNFRGRIFDENRALVSDAEFEFKDMVERKYATKSDNEGRFEINLPVDMYTVQISKSGFRTLTITNFDTEGSKGIYLDLELKIRGCDDCDGDILGRNNGENRKGIIVDYKTIKQKNNN